jgi:hypothetical protein
MPLSDIVSVNVSINQSTVAQQGFGVPLILAPMPGGAVVRTYRATDWSAAMIADGVLSGVPEATTRLSSAYLCAAQMMKQSPRPTTFKVGKRTAPETQVTWLMPVVQNSAVYSVQVTGPNGVLETATYASDASASGTEIVAGLVASLNALSADFVATAAGGTHVILTASAPDRLFTIVPTTANLTRRNETAATDIATDLDAIVEVDNDWYGLCLASSAPDAIEACADWIEGQKKIFVASTDDQHALEAANEDIDPIASVNAQNYARTHVAYHSKALEFYGASWMAAVITYEPGAVDWKFKQLRGVTTDKLTASQTAQLALRGGSYYENPIRGVDMTGAAIGGDGVFLDLTQLSDWTVARVQEGIVGMLAASPKTGFTDQDGGNKIWGVLSNVIQEGVRLGAIDEDPTTYSVFVPKRATLSPAARVARRWEGCSFSFVPTGAVHSVGTIQVYLNIAS